MNGQKSGRGTFTSAVTGDVYSGEYAEDDRGGYGVCSYGAGAVYEGAWAAGQRSGQGTLRQPDGGSYTGDWLEDMFHGEGQLISLGPGGGSFEYHGEFRRGNRHGRGVCRYADSSMQRYEGAWKDDKPDGLGSLLYSDGKMHDGLFSEGVCHGFGTLKSAKVKVLLMFFLSHVLTYVAKLHWTKGNCIYRGMFKYGVRHADG